MIPAVIPIRAEEEALRVTTAEAVAALIRAAAVIPEAEVTPAAAVIPEAEVIPAVAAEKRRLTATARNKHKTDLQSTKEGDEE
jgi:phosphohistidine swiveling domain-containing protein